jgi:hypothetical protein
MPPRDIPNKDNQQLGSRMREDVRRAKRRVEFLSQSLFD